jgi:hypothetical protein
MVLLIMAPSFPGRIPDRRGIGALLTFHRDFRWHSDPEEIYARCGETDRLHRIRDDPGFDHYDKRKKLLTRLESLEVAS